MNVSYSIQSAVRGLPHGTHPLPQRRVPLSSRSSLSGRSGFEDGLCWSNPFFLPVPQPPRSRVRRDAGETVTEPLRVSQKEISLRIGYWRQIFWFVGSKSSFASFPRLQVRRKVYPKVSAWSRTKVHVVRSETPKGSLTASYYPESPHQVRSH